MTTRGGFQAEYAKTSRSACKGCGSTIKQGKLRVGKETPSSFRDGWDLSWYHLKCAPTYKKSSEIAGFDWLRWDDQLDIKKRVKEDTTETPDIKRHKKEVDQLWDLIDDLDSNVNSKTLKGLLEANGFKIEKVTPARLLHKAADGLLWGRIGDCPDCASASTLRYTGYTYECKGWFSEFTRCTFKGTEGVKRYAFKIPSAYKKDFSFFTFPKTHPKEDYKASKKKDSDSVSSSESESSSEEEEIDESIKEDKIPEGQEMYGMNVMIIGTKRDLGMSQAEIRDMIEEHGGEVDVSLLSDTRFIIASESEVKKKTKSKKLQQGLTAGLPVFSVDYITDLCEESQTKLRERSNAKKYLIGGKLDKPLCVRYNLELIKKREEKEKLKEEKEQKKQEKENKKKKAVQKKKKTLPPLPGSDILKVDADSELDKVGEILVTNTDRYGYTCYNVMLNQTDLDSGVNKFYRIQLIKKKGKAAWHVWTSWGRIGTSRGDNGLYDFKSESKAIDFFAKKFFERTHVQWEDRDTFQKQKGHYFMVSLDDGNEELSSEDEDDDDEKSNKPSARMRKKLKQEVDPKEEKEEMDTEEPIPPRVQQLVQLIFDKDMINNALKSMDIDVE